MKLSLVHYWTQTIILPFTFPLWQTRQINKRLLLFRSSSRRLTSKTFVFNLEDLLDYSWSWSRTCGITAATTVAMTCVSNMATAASFLPPIQSKKKQSARVLIWLRDPDLSSVKRQNKTPGFINKLAIIVAHWWHHNNAGIIMTLKNRAERDTTLERSLISYPLLLRR